MYVLQLAPERAGAWRYCVSWSGYHAGLGYVADMNKAVKYATRDDAASAAMGIHVGLNGYLKIVPYSDLDREYGPIVQPS